MNTTDASAPSFGDIPLECIRASKTNPRKIFDATHLNELAASIKKQGVAQPILVRPIETIKDVTYFEIVAGERRFRASLLAGMATVPAIVRELSDRDAFEIQVLENLQRVDLHPLEEAEGFEALMTAYKVTADELAEKVGKSKAYIYARLKLCALEPAARKAFYDGSLTASTALLVARIPVKALQVKCAKEITTMAHLSSTRAAANYIETNYMLRLGKVTFKTSDATLCEDVGSCTDCPKRTGNQPEVYADVNADVCTDPICFKAKGDANVIRIKQLAIANGQTVLTGAEAKKVLPSSYSDVKGGFVDLDKPNYNDAKNRTFRQILGKEAPPAVLLESPYNSTIHHLVKIADIKPLLEKKGIKQAGDSSLEDAAAKAREKAQEDKAKLEREYRKRLFTRIHHSSHMMNLIDADLRLVAAIVFDNLPCNETAIDVVMDLYGWKKDEVFKHPRSESIKAAIDSLTPAQLNQFIRDCTLAVELRVNVYTVTPKDGPHALQEAAKRARVDAKAIRSDVDAEAKAKLDAKKKKGGAKPAAPAAKAKAAAPAKKATAKPAKKVTKPAAKAKGLQAKASIAKANDPAWPFPSRQDTQAAVVAAKPSPSVSPPAAAWPFPTRDDGTFVGTKPAPAADTEA